MMSQIKKAVFYCDVRSLNDATNYYCGIIKKSIVSKGYSFEIIHKLSDIKKPDLILTITEKYFLWAKLRFPNTKSIFWAQGVSAEEAKMNLSTFGQKIRYCFRRFAEPIAVKKSDILFCVSEKMVEYYQKTYGLKRHEQIIVMPCYNLMLSDNFEIKQYDKPIFAYAGNASAWQGVDFMLEVYALVEKKISNAELRIFTKNKQEFESKINEKGISNYSINYIPVDELQKYLHKCKYGLIIRNNHIVNMVATPTKMNSYLAAYMIPIYSDGVDDFRLNINLGEFRLMGTSPLNAQALAKQIIKFEMSNHDYSKYQAIVKQVFKNHYNDEKYHVMINQLLDKIS